MKVIDRITQKALSPEEIILEANRYLSVNFNEYTLADLKEWPEDVLDWLDPEYFQIIR